MINSLMMQILADLPQWIANVNWAVELEGTILVAKRLTFWEQAH